MKREKTSWKRREGEERRMITKVNEKRKGATKWKLMMNDGRDKKKEEDDTKGSAELRRRRGRNKEYNTKEDKQQQPLRSLLGCLRLLTNYQEYRQDSKAEEKRRRRKKRRRRRRKRRRRKKRSKSIDKLLSVWPIRASRADAVRKEK